MPEDVMEDDLLRSIDEVDAKLQDFRKRVRAVLSDLQADSNKSPTNTEAGSAS